MASVRKRGKTWMGLFRDADGRQRSAGSYPTQKEAMKAARLAEAGVTPVKTQTAYATTVRGNTTVASYGFEWLPSHSISPATREVYSRVLTNRILPVLGGHVLASVTAADIRAYFRQLEGQGASQAHMAKDKTVMSAMFQTAAEDGLIPFNPVRGIRFTAAPPKRRRALSAAEWHRLRECLRGEDRLFAEVQMATGARVEEIRGMMTGDITNGVWHVCRVRKELKAGFVTVDKTKTGRDRFIQMDPALVERLMEHPGRVFSDVVRDVHWKRWRRACDKAGLGWYPAVRDLRRTFATLARAGGADLEHVRVALGHAKIATTDIYLAERPDTTTVALEAVQRALAVAS
jgi:integrase